MRSWKQRFRRAATDWLSLPPDALLNVPRLTCIGAREVVVENIHSVLRVSESSVEIDLDESVLLVQGDHFVVTLISDREVHVKGEVQQLSYAPKRGRGR